MAIRIQRPPRDTAGTSCAERSGVAFFFLAEEVLAPV
jgi:hypothetical protein